MILQVVRSGGQTGADEGAWEAAEDHRIARSGWMIGGFLTEAGARPEYESRHGAKLLPGVSGLSLAAQYRRRAMANVEDSDGTLCFDLAGSKATENVSEDSKRFGKAFFRVFMGRDAAGRIYPLNVAHTPLSIADWIVTSGIAELNVAGNRESKAPGIQAYIRGFLGEVFAILKQGET